jgi:NAD(P)-dependent dehydrogenase (short-subunit alcohol dehydrogenase family)
MTPGQPNVADKVIFLSGAFGLFGRRLATVFLDNGAKVILCAHRMEKASSWLNDNSHKYDTEKIAVLPLDLTSDSSMADAVENSVKSFGRIDVLINNAAIDAKFDKEHIGSLENSGFENYPIDLIRQSVECNIVGTVRLTQLVCKIMSAQQSGNIINVGSIYSLLSPNKSLYEGINGPQMKPVDYVISKSFIPNFTRYIAANYAGKNIRCNAIAPHGIFYNHEETFVQNFKAMSPSRRMCRIEEIDGPFLFLASDASSYVNGEVMVLDGGWSVW